MKQCVRVPVFVMIRPRGGDFLYSDREVEVMKADIRLAKLHGADGLVFGALTEDGRIDTELCTALLGEGVSTQSSVLWQRCGAAPADAVELCRGLRSAHPFCGPAVSFHLFRFHLLPYP